LVDSFNFIWLRLRINEALQLRIKDINLADNTLFVFRGKGRKDRYTLLPHSLKFPIESQIQRVKLMHDKDIREGFGLTSLPPSILRKYSSSAKDNHGNTYYLLQPVVFIHMMDISVGIIYMVQRLEKS
jgi:integrase